MPTRSPAAETGIERTLASGIFNPAAAAAEPERRGNGRPTTGRRRSRLQLGGNPLPALWGNSWNSFATYHFEIQSTGTSMRSATAVNNQGVAIISPWDPTIQNDPNLADQTLH